MLVSWLLVLGLKSKLVSYLNPINYEIKNPHPQSLVQFLTIAGILHEIQISMEDGKDGATKFKTAAKVLFPTSRSNQNMLDIKFIKPAKLCYLYICLVWWFISPLLTSWKDSYYGCLSVGHIVGKDKQFQDSKKTDAH